MYTHDSRGANRIICIAKNSRRDPQRATGTDKLIAEWTSDSLIYLQTPVSFPYFSTRRVEYLTLNYSSTRQSDIKVG